MKKWMYIALAGLLCMATPALADVTLTGDGEVSAAPDVGYVTVGVVSEAETAADSVAANTAAMSKLYESMDALGIDKKHVETSQFSLQPKYEYQDKQPPKLVGYMTTNMVTLTICDLKQMGKVLDTLVREGGNRVHGIRFGVVNSKPLLDEARKLAVQDVKRKASLFAEAGDFSLGKMKSFTESSHSNHHYPKYAARAMAMEAAADVPVSGGELTFRVQVHVSWDIVCDVCEVCPTSDAIQRPKTKRERLNRIRKHQLVP